VDLVLKADQTISVDEINPHLEPDRLSGFFRSDILLKENHMECEIPLRNAENGEIVSIFNKYDTVALVGFSRDPGKDSHKIGKYLIENGFKVIPVNPSANEILGDKVYHNLKDIPDEINVDIVCIFRPSDEAGEIVDDAIAISAKVIWMQLGIVNNVAADKARSAGLHVVMNKCMKIEHHLWLDRTSGIPA